MGCLWMDDGTGCVFVIIGGSLVLLLAGCLAACCVWANKPDPRRPVEQLPFVRGTPAGQQQDDGAAAEAAPATAAAGRAGTPPRSREKSGTPRRQPPALPGRAGPTHALAVLADIGPVVGPPLAATSSREQAGLPAVLQPLKKAPSLEAVRVAKGATAQKREAKATHGKRAGAIIAVSGKGRLTSPPPLGNKPGQSRGRGGPR